MGTLSNYWFWYREGSDEKSNKNSCSSSGLIGKLMEGVEEAEEGKNDEENGGEEACLLPVKDVLQGRPESPANPYNKSEYRAHPPWPGENTRKTSVVNSVESLECGDLANVTMESCSCCPTGKHEDGCCKTDLARKLLYNEIKDRVIRAIKVCCWISS